VLTAFEAARPGRAKSATINELLPYTTTPAQKAALAKVAAAQKSDANQTQIPIHRDSALR
jgi:hypothetical protein